MINIIDTLTPKNNGDFPVVEAVDISVGEQRLPEVLNNKADKTSTYAKSEVDTKIANVKVDAYTKSETDEKLSEKADTASLQSLEGVVNTKASGAELAVLSQVVESKVSKTEFEIFKSKAESDIETLYSDADTKATKTELDVFAETTAESISEIENKKLTNQI